MKIISYFLLGVLFAAGLLISGMTQPLKVIGFLDVAGAWDPALMLVMGGAVLVTFIGYRWVLKRPTPVLASGFDLPKVTKTDPRLMTGAAMFGLGWGLVGFCPGPAIVALASGSSDVMIFVGAMIVGFVIIDVVAPRTAATASPA